MGHKARLLAMGTAKKHSSFAIKPVDRLGMPYPYAFPFLQRNPSHYGKAVYPLKD